MNDALGALCGGVAVLHDITERKRVEEALRDSEEKLRLALEGARLGTWNWDLKTGELVGSPGLRDVRPACGHEIRLRNISLHASSGRPGHG
jgi:PAS domain-containing protein